MSLKKIFAFVGSAKGMESNTFKLVKKVLDQTVIKTNNVVQYEILTSKEVNIHHCCGCQKCFTEGICCLDRIDGFNKIKEKISSADMIIFGSPVYACAVSADMKVFIDRLSYWLHLLKLAGKPGVTFVTASSNSANDVIAYLKRIMQILGMQVICNISCYVDMPNMLDSLEFNNENIPSYVEILSQYIDGTKVVEPTEFHNKYFDYLRYLYSNSDNLQNSEVRYWKESGYLKYKSYTKLLKAIQSNKLRMY